MTLYAAVKATLPHAAPKNAYTPVIETLRVEHGKVTATDRYTIAVSTFDAGNMQKFEPFLLHRDDAKQVRNQSILAIEHEAAENRVTLIYIDDSSQTFRTAPGNYPDVNRILDNYEPTTSGIPKIMLAPKHLEKMKASVLARGRVEKGMGFVMEFGKTEGDPVRVTFSDHFTGLIMPIRPSN